MGSDADRGERALGLSIRIERGTLEDYRGLAHFHYVSGTPAVVAGIWRAVARERSRRSKDRRRVVGVIVLTYPTPSLGVRERVLRLRGSRYGRKLKFLNRHVRRIARVIVHPQFRSLGVATKLVRRVLSRCRTRYVEALALMGDFVPFFERAGMIRHDPARAGDPTYFLFDRDVHRRRARARAI